MKITIDCFGRDNDALSEATNEELQHWLIGRANEYVRNHDNLDHAVIRDINGNQVARIIIEEDDQ